MNIQQYYAYMEEAIKAVQLSAEIITPEIATEMMTHNTSNRRLDDNRIQINARTIKELRWWLNGESIIFSKDGTLIDGQHRLTAIIKAGIPIASVVVRNVDYDAFSTIDSGKSRQASDVLCIQGVTNATKKAACIRRYQALHLNRVTRGGVRDGKSLANDEVNKFYLSNRELVDEAVKVSVSNGTTSFCFIQPALLAGLYLYLVKDKKHSGEMVADFIGKAFGNISTQSQTLKKLKELFAISKRNQRFRLSAATRDAYITKAWNAYVSKREMKRISWSPDEGRIEYL